MLLLAACLWSVTQIAMVSPAGQLLLTEALPIASLALAMLLIIRFNCSRYSFILCFLAIAGLSQTWFRGLLLPATESVLFLVLIANAFVFSFIKDQTNLLTTLPKETIRLAKIELIFVHCYHITPLIN